MSDHDEQGDRCLHRMGKYPAELRCRFSKKCLNFTRTAAAVIFLFFIGFYSPMRSHVEMITLSSAPELLQKQLYPMEVKLAKC